MKTRQRSFFLEGITHHVETFSVEITFWLATERLLLFKISSVFAPCVSPQCALYRRHELFDILQPSATTLNPLKPLAGEANNTDHVITVKHSAGKPSVIFIRSSLFHGAAKQARQSCFDGTRGTYTILGRRLLCYGWSVYIHRGLEKDIVYELIFVSWKNTGEHSSSSQQTPMATSYFLSYPVV